MKRRDTVCECPHNLPQKAAPILLFLQAERLRLPPDCREARRLLKPRPDLLLLLLVLDSCRTVLKSVLTQLWCNPEGV
jgi:hypothetical protein